MAADNHGLVLDAETVVLSVAGDEKQPPAYFPKEEYDGSRFDEVDISKSALALDQAYLEQLPTFYAALRVGPLIALITFGWGLTVPLWVELLKRRVCAVELGYNATVCSHVADDQYKTQGNAVRSSTAQYQLYDTLLGLVPSVFFSLIVGAWSDRFGRKIPMLMPMIGTLLGAIYISIIGNYPLGPAFNLVSSVLAVITGGSSILFMAIFSYVGDHSTPKNRSVNIVILECLMRITQNAGSYLGGFLENQFSLVVPYYVATGLHASATAYIVLVIRDRKKHAVSEAPAGLGGLFSLANVKDIVRMLRKVRFGDTRLHLWLVVGCLAFFNMVLAGDGAITQLFTQFDPIKWTLQDYTQWTAITGFVNSGLSMVLMLLMRKYFHINDSLIGCVACLSAALAYFVYGIAWAGWLLYVGAFIGVFKVLMYVCVRSLLSTLVDSDEIGKSMSLVGLVQAITPSLGVLIFTNLFAQTSHWWPGLCFVTGAASLIPVLGVMAYVDVIRRRDMYKEKSTT